MPRRISVRGPIARQFHRAGPVETETVAGVDGATRRVQRCLRCDREIVVVLDVDGEASAEVTVGRRIGLEDSCPGMLP